MRRTFSRIEAWLDERFVAEAVAEVVVPLFEPPAKGRTFDVGCGGAP